MRINNTFCEAEDFSRGIFKFRRHKKLNMFLFYRKDIAERVSNYFIFYFNGCPNKHLKEFVTDAECILELEVVPEELPSDEYLNLLLLKNAKL